MITLKEKTYNIKDLALSHFKWVMREEIHSNSPLIKGELPTHFEKEPNCLYVIPEVLNRESSVFKVL